MMRDTKVAIFAPEIHPPFIEGVQKSAWATIQEFLKQDIRVFVFTQQSFGQRMDVIKNLEVFCSFSTYKHRIIKYLLWCFSAWNIFFTLKREKVSTVFVFSLDLPFLVPLCLLLCLNKNIHVHVVVFSFRETMMVQKYFILMFKKRINHFFVRSQTMKQRLSHLGVPNAHNSISLPFLYKDAFTDQSVGDIRTQDNVVRIAYLSNAEYSAGIFEIVALAKQMKECEFSIALRQFSGTEEEKIRTFLDTLKKDHISNIVVLRNISNMAEFLSGMDCVVLPPKDDTASMDVPMIMLEAFMAKTAVITSDIGIFQDFKQRGYVRTFQSVEDLAALIHPLITNKAYYSKQVADAHAFCCTLPAIEMVVGEYITYI